MTDHVVPIMSTTESSVPMPTPTAEELAAPVRKVSIEQPSSRLAPVTNANVRITVPLDATAHSVYTERKLMRRDSLERREALLKGKEGSRQRRRWENDRLISNPWAVPPLPSDWEVRPTYQRRTVPYYLAPLWDAAEFQRAVESKLKDRRGSTRSRGKGAHNTGMSPMEEAAANIPKEIRAKLKRAKAAKGMLKDLEEPVRQFVRKWNRREIRLKKEGLGDVPLTSDSEEDEEIVFIGRNGAMHDSPMPDADEKHRDDDDDDDGTISTEKMVFESLNDDKGAGFARYLVHCVGSYYGLRTWSVTRETPGEEKMRQAFVGLDKRARGFMGRGVELGREIELPQPLWGMV